MRDGVREGRSPARSWSRACPRSSSRRGTTRDECRYRPWPGTDPALGVQFDESELTAPLETRSRTRQPRAAGASTLDSRDSATVDQRRITGRTPGSVGFAATPAARGLPKPGKSPARNRTVATFGGSGTEGSCTDGRRRPKKREARAGDRSAVNPSTAGNRGIMSGEPCRSTPIYRIEFRI